MPAVRRSFAGGATAFDADDWVASIRIDGVVTPAGGGAILRGCHEDLLASRAPALFADYRAAALQVTAEALLGSVAPVFSADSPLRVPTALLVRPDDLEVWRLYCRLQGMSGILRAAFISPDDARRWLADQAALFAAQVNHHARRR